MRRFPTPWLPLAAVVLTAGITGSARAADAAGADAGDTKASHTEENNAPVVAIADVPSSADDPVPAPASASASPASPAPTTASPASPMLTPVLAPTATVAGEADADKEGKFPLHGGLNLSNAAGNGFLAPASTGQMQPQWSTSLGLRGSASLPQVDFLPKLSVSTGVSFSVANWLDSYTNGGVYSRQVRASDVSLGLAAAELYKEPFTKIGIGANLSGRIPVSITSRHRNVLTTLGVGLPVSWSSDEASWGTISASFSPGARLSLYTAPATTIPCEAGVTQGEVVENPLEAGLLPRYYGLEAQIAPDGSCVLPGRQSTVALSAALGVGWSLGDHSVSADIGYGAGFLQALPSNVDHQSEFASNQDFNETTNGSIAYSYKVPVDFSLNISAGLSSSQSPWRITGLDADNNTLYEPNFPFWDFNTPASNSSSAFVDVSIGL